MRCLECNGTRFKMGNSYLLWTEEVFDTETGYYREWETDRNFQESDNLCCATCGSPVGPLSELYFEIQKLREP